MVCKCGGKEFFTEKHGNHIGLYCSDCGAWQKWANNDEARLFNYGVNVENAKTPNAVKLVRLCLCPASSSISIETLVGSNWTTYATYTVFENGLVSVSLLRSVVRFCELGYKIEVIDSNF